jgi:hypothetical protein
MDVRLLEMYTVKDPAGRYNVGTNLNQHLAPPINTPLQRSLLYQPTRPNSNTFRRKILT